MYTPAFRVASRYEGHFQPTMVTDSAGNATREIAEAAAPVQAEERRRVAGLEFSPSVPSGFPLVARARC